MSLSFFLSLRHAPSEYAACLCMPSCVKSNIGGSGLSSIVASTDIGNLDVIRISYLFFFISINKGLKAILS